MRFTISSLVWFAAAIITSVAGMAQPFVYFCIGAGVLWQIAGAIVEELKR